MPIALLWLALQTARWFPMHIDFSMQNTFTSANFKHLCMQSEHHMPVEHASCVVCIQIQCCLLSLKRTGLLKHKSHTCTKTGCSVCLPTHMHTFSHLCMHACTHTHIPTSTFDVERRLEHRAQASWELRWLTKHTHTHKYTKVVLMHACVDLIFSNQCTYAFILCVQIQ